MGMTVGEHTDLLKAALKSLPGIREVLQEQERATRVANAIECAKELHRIGAMDEAEYKRSLLRLLDVSGFRME